MATHVVLPALQLPDGGVRGLQTRVSVEPEVALHTSSLHAPRLVAPNHPQPASFDTAFDAVADKLDAHIVQAMAVLDMPRLHLANSELEAVCEQYVRNALSRLGEEGVPAWHHKLLYAWCAQQVLPDDSELQPRQARLDDVQSPVWAELQLAERCGPPAGELRSLSAGPPFCACAAASPLSTLRR